MITPKSSTLSPTENFVIGLVVEVVCAATAGWLMWLVDTPVWMGVLFYAVANFIFSYRRKARGEA